MSLICFLVLSRYLGKASADMLMVYKHLPLCRLGFRNLKLNSLVSFFTLMNRMPVLQIVTKHLKQDNGNIQSSSKPQSESLLAQVRITLNMF